MLSLKRDIPILNFLRKKRQKFYFKTLNKNSAFYFTTFRIPDLRYYILWIGKKAVKLRL